MLNVGLFKNDKGSTSLTVLVSIALTVALLSMSLQWYWTNTTSADVQHFADIGALAAGEAVGRVASVIQVLDLFLLTTNLFGLVVHGITVVAGIISVSGTPFAVGASAFLPRAIEFDKKFVEARKKFSDAAFKAAKKASDMAPYLMFGYASAMVNDDINLRAEYNATSYRIIPILFPARGTVTRSAYPSDEHQIMDQIETASNENSEAARRLQELEEQRRGVLDAAYTADVYKDVDDVRASWTLDEALDHFRRQGTILSQKAKDRSIDLVPIDTASEPAHVRLKNAYIRDCEIVMDRVFPKIANSIGRYQPNTETYSSEALSLSALFSDIRADQIYLLEHTAAQRKAYHADDNCSGLQNAQNVLNAVELGYVMGDEDHPPCSLCLPIHWGSVQRLEEVAATFINYWNIEAGLIEQYNLLTSEIRDLTNQVQTISSEAFEMLLSRAKEYLSGGRLTYEPAGARGILCVAFSTDTRNLPKFTLPGFTNTDEVELGAQIALAGVRLYPTKDCSSIPSSAESVNKNITFEIPRLGGAIFNLLDIGSGLAPVMMSIWEACTGAIARGDNRLETTVGDIPWGLGTLLSSTLRSLKEAAGVSKADTRTLKPFLVNTAMLGDPDMPGPEGVFARNIRNAKKIYEQTGAGSVPGLAGIMQESLSVYEGNIIQKVLSVLPGTFDSGGALMLPFYRGLDTVTESSIRWAKEHAHEVIAAIQ